jgi:hypothetical protein
MSLFKKAKRLYDEHRMEKLEKFISGFPLRRERLERRQRKALAKYESLRAQLGGATQASITVSPESGALKSR